MNTGVWINPRTADPISVWRAVLPPMGSLHQATFVCQIGVTGYLHDRKRRCLASRGQGPAETRLDVTLCGNYILHALEHCLVLGSGMITITVTFFGPAKDFAGEADVELELPEGATIATLRRVLSEKYSRLGDALPTIRLALNEEFVTDEARLKPDDEVALIPPVSGGADDDDVWVDLVTGSIPVQSVRDFVMGDPNLGGIATFEGVTRGDSDATHGPVRRLDYECHETMARRALRRLAGEAKERWRLGKVAVVHRLGPVEVAEVSVMVAVASAHRAESFEACRWLIDSLKRDVPIWKKEVYADGHVDWGRSEHPKGTEES